MSTTTRVLLAACLLVTLCVSSVSATCSRDPTAPVLKFYGQNESCNSVDRFCKNFLLCYNGVCVLPDTVGSNCTTPGSPCISDAPTFLICNNNHTCETRNRDNGDACTLNAHCLSGLCSGKNRCLGSRALGESCAIEKNECEVGLVCRLISNVNNGSNVNETLTCQKPLKLGEACYSSQVEWESSTNPFNRVCAPGLICLQNSTVETNYACVQLYGAKEGDACYAPGPGLFCNYTLFCGKSLTNATDDLLKCRSYPSAKESALVKDCSSQPAVEPPQCSFGSVCDCLSTNNGTQNSCVNIFNGGDECNAKLSALLTCSKTHACAHIAGSLPYSATQSSPSHVDVESLRVWFGDVVPAGLCLSSNCDYELRSFVCCQNRGYPTKDNSTRSFVASPAYVPSNGLCNLDNGWPNWVVPVIVLSGIIFVVVLIVSVYIIINRPDMSDSYEPINK